MNSRTMRGDIAARHGAAAEASLRAFDEIVRTIAFAGTEPVLESVIPLVRDFLEGDQALAYRLGVREGGLDVDFGHCAGGGPMEHLLREARAFVGRASGPLTAYRLPSPAPAERNTIFNSAAPETREQYLRSPFVREFFPRLGFRGQEQIRVLICEGPHLLTWLGAFRSESFGAGEAERLEMLIEPLAKRLALEERLRRLSLRDSALDAAMEALGAPAFILDPRGEVAHANEAGAALSKDERVELIARGRRLLGGQAAADEDLSLLSIQAPGLPPHAFLYQRAGPTAAQRLAACERRWKLTGRQVEVLRAIVRGGANKTIAAALGIREKTVEVHVTSLLRKAGVESRSELVAAFWSARGN